MLLSGGLILSTDSLNTYGCLMGVVSVGYYMLVNKNPFVTDHTGLEPMTLRIQYGQFVRCLGILGGLLIAMARGKIQYED